jgi:hypothetical protein
MILFRCLYCSCPILASDAQAGRHVRCPVDGSSIPVAGACPFTEVEWLECADARLLRSFLHTTASDRKNWLFEAFGWRRLHRVVPVARILRAAVVTERVADGLAEQEELQRVCNDVYRGAGVSDAQWQLARDGEGPAVRELIGNPFHAVAIDPSWLRWDGRRVLKLAQAIYQGHRFGDLPILADAVEEAGCADSRILDHCRQPAEHARGCWLLDALLGKQ